MVGWKQLGPCTNALFIFGCGTPCKEHGWLSVPFSIIGQEPPQEHDLGSKADVDLKELTAGGCE